MKKIGLDAHYWYFNGWNGCLELRLRASQLLADAIRESHDEGLGIALPDDQIIELFKRIASEGEKNDHTLTNTWQAASTIIRAHIHLAEASPQVRKAGFIRLRSQILRYYFAQQ